MSAQNLVDTMKKLIARETRDALPRWRWGQVTSTSPLTVKLDAQQGTIAGIGTTVAGLMIGDRVNVRTWKTRSLITGVAGGAGSGIRTFATLAAATAANLPVGSQIWVTGDNQGYVLKTAGQWGRLRTSADYETGTVTPSGVTGTITWEREGRLAAVRYDLTGVVVADRIVGVMPSSIKAQQIMPGAEYQYSGGPVNPAYIDRASATLRIPAQTGVTRRAGWMTYTV